jgi:transposase
MTYSLDFRKKVLLIRSKERLTFQVVADRFDVGIASVVRWCQKLEPQTTRDKPATKIDMAALVLDVKNYPDGYHHERSERLGVSIRCVGFALHRLGVTYKKSLAASEGGRRQTAQLPEKD